MNLNIKMYLSLFIICVNIFTFNLCKTIEKDTSSLEFANLEKKFKDALKLSELLDKDRKKLFSELKEPESKALNENLYSNLDSIAKEEILEKQNSFPSVQSLIDQTNTISSNLELMITEMNNNNRKATAAMLRVMLNNVRRLNTSLVRLNYRVLGSSISTTASSVATSTTVNNFTSLLITIRNQLNTLSGEINALMKRIIPGSTPKPNTPKG